MTRPRGDRMKPKLKLARTPEFPNVTTIRGEIVHAYGGDGKLAPLCGWHQKSTRFTSEPVTCARCREALDGG